MVLFIINCEFFLSVYAMIRVLSYRSFISSNSLNSLWEGKSIGYVLLGIKSTYVSLVSYVVSHNNIYLSFNSYRIWNGGNRRTAEGDPTNHW